MESGEEGLDIVFDAFRGGGFVELLGAGDFAGVGEMLGMEEGDVEEHKVPVVEGEGVEMGGFLHRYDPACAPPRSSSLSCSSYRMMCFGGDECFPNDGNTKGFSRKSSESCSSTSSSSSNSGVSKSKKKTEQRRDRSSAEERSRTVTAASTKATSRASAATKKPRKEPQQPPSSQRRTSKVRKEKLGERITALQQLVSPFGKTDTASVLHEALGYVRFLHDQVQVLSSPYLQQLPSSARLPHGDAGREEEEPRLDLRSRGLCLVPLACTAQVAGSNGADFWSPAMWSGGDHHQHAFSKH